MAKLLRYVDDRKTCWAGLRFENGEPCWISVSQQGVVVKKSTFGLFGKLLYKSSQFDAFKKSDQLYKIYSDDLTPKEMQDAVLKNFTNAVVHCKSADEAMSVLNSPT